MSESDSMLALLTGRERHIVEKLAEGKSNEAIAKELLISRHTVRQHLIKIFDKLDKNSRLEVTVAYYREKLVLLEMQNAFLAGQLAACDELFDNAV